MGCQVSFFFGVVALSFARSLALSLSLSPFFSGGREGRVGGRQVCAGDAWASWAVARSFARSLALPLSLSLSLSFSGGRETGGNGGRQVNRATLGFKVCVQGLGFRVLVLGWSGVLFLGGLSLARSLARSLSLSLSLSISFSGGRETRGEARTCKETPRKTKGNQGKPRKNKEHQGIPRTFKEKR